MQTEEDAEAALEARFAVNDLGAIAPQAHRDQNRSQAHLSKRQLIRQGRLLGIRQCGAYVAGQQNADEDQPRFVVVRLACNATESEQPSGSSSGGDRWCSQSRAGLDSTIDWPPICNH
jgi:hypothetical protein